MSSKSMCSRCLRLAMQQNRTVVTSQRAFTSTSTPNPSRRRHIHDSSRRRAPEPDVRRSQNAEIPPFSATRARGLDRTPQNPFERALLRPDNLFQSFTNSPSPQIRKRAAVIRQNAYCPHPAHQPTRNPQSPHDTESRKTGSMPPAHVRYECPDCGIPVSCSEEHFASDYENHLQICGVLRQINEDDHDLVSGRLFPEFDYPGPQIEEAQVNMTNWDTMLYSREFTAINDERSMRQVTRLLTYPITVGSVLHELSPYSLKHRITPEGLRSLSGTYHQLLLKLPAN
jgi:mitochondrial splicing suppressor protein 51